MTTEALLYARISVTDKNVPKVENQLADIRKLAEIRGYSVAGEYVDDGLSALKAENRPDYERLIRTLPDHKGCVILATEEARLCRNELEKALLVIACQNVGATWETKRDGAVDPSTAEGVLMATMRGGIDAFESRRKGQRQKAALEHRRNAGLAPNLGPRPFGWNEDRKTICEPEAALIRKGVADALAGKNLTAITMEWRASESKPSRAEAWGRVTIMKTLTRWRNAAVVAYKDEPVNEGKGYQIGQWEPIVSVDDLVALRKLLMIRGQKRVASRLLTGIVRCHCGEYMIVTGAKTVTGYKCSASIRGIKTKITNHCGMDAKLLDGIVINALVDVYLADPSGSHGAAEADAEALRKMYERRQKAQAAIANLTDSIEAGVLRPGEVAGRMKKHRDTIDAIDIEIARLTSDSAHAAMVNEIMSTLWTAFDALEPDAMSGRVKVRVDRNSKAGAGRYASRAPEVRAALVDKFTNGLSLDQQRVLVRSLLSITVNPWERGQAAEERVEVKAFGSQM